MSSPTARRIAVTGSSGLIGAALVRALRAGGDEVVRLVRRAPRAADEVHWEPQESQVDPVLGPVDAVVNLAGAPISRRWSPAAKREILHSRLAATRTAARLVARQSGACVLVNGSAVGIYGSDRGEEPLTEQSARGATFLADVVARWEDATQDASRAGQRVALARTGIVLSPDGGALGPLLPLARLGLAGPIGTGRQYWPWISLPDEVRALVHLVDHDVAGPVNLVGPEPARQGEIMAAVGRVLDRPAAVPTPAAALRLALGEFAADILGSQRVVPEVLQRTGFRWVHPTAEAAVGAVLSPWHSLPGDD